MGNTSFTIKTTKGKYNFLDRTYLNLILENTKIDADLERWEIYSIIIEEVIKLSGSKEFQKIKYQLTGDTDPNDVMLEIIDNYSEDSELLSSLRNIILEFIDEDWLNQFF